MNPKKILVVDDDKKLVMGLAIRLKASGYSVVSAFDAVTALMVAMKEKPDLILLDLGLPAGGGMEFLERMNSHVSLIDTPVIVLTARDVPTYEERVFKLGAQAFLQKPADNDQLLGAIRKALGEPDLSPAAQK